MIIKGLSKKVWLENFRVTELLESAGLEVQEEQKERVTVIWNFRPTGFTCTDILMLFDVKVQLSSYLQMAAINRYVDISSLFDITFVVYLKRF